MAPNIEVNREPAAEPVKKAGKGKCVRFEKETKEGGREGAPAHGVNNNNNPLLLPGLDPDSVYVVSGPFQYFDPAQNMMTGMLMATPIPQGVTVVAVPSGPNPSNPASLLKSPPKQPHKPTPLNQTSNQVADTPPGVQLGIPKPPPGGSPSLHQGSPPATNQQPMPGFQQGAPNFQPGSLTINPGSPPNPFVGSPAPNHHKGCEPVSMYPCFSSPPPAAHTDSACLTLGGGANSPGGPKMQIPVKNTGGGCPLHRPHGGTPHMLYWDANHPTGATIPLRQPNPPVYFNVPESPSMSGSQSPISEMTIGSTDLSGEESSVEYQEEKICQEMNYMTINQNSNSGNQNQNTVNHNVNNNVNFNQHMNKNITAATSHQFSMQGQQHNPTMTAQPTLQITNGNVPVMVNTAPHGFYASGEQEGSRGIPAESTVPSFNGQLYQQTNQFNHIQPNHMQVPTSQITNTLSYPVNAHTYPVSTSSYPSSPVSFVSAAGYPVNQPIYPTSVPMTGMSPPLMTGGAVYPNGQPIQYVVHYGNQNQPTHHQQPILYDYNLHTMVH